MLFKRKYQPADYAVREEFMASQTDTQSCKSSPGVEKEVFYKELESLPYFLSFLLHSHADRGIISDMIF